MRYEIQGDTLPVVICYLDGGEKMITEKGAMSWMSPNMHMATSTNGGIGKAFGRMFSGESMFQNIYTAQGGPGMIAFASCFPGSILPYQISPGRELIVQKSGFLASEAGVNLSVFFQKRFGSGLFGGEGFIMQRLAGEGMVFLEFDGHVVEYDLQPGQQIIVELNTGLLSGQLDQGVLGDGVGDLRTQCLSQLGRLGDGQSTVLSEHCGAGVLETSGELRHGCGVLRVCHTLASFLMSVGGATGSVCEAESDVSP